MNLKLFIMSDSPLHLGITMETADQELPPVPMDTFSLPLMSQHVCLVLLTW